MNGDVEDTIQLRSRIYEDAKNTLFGYKGGVNFTSLSGRNIEYIFDLYDRYFFDGEIRQKIEDEGSTVYFFSKPRTEGAVGICGAYTDSEKTVYYFDIAPNIIADTVRTSIKGPDRTRLTHLLTVIECLIVQLIMLVWDMYHKDGGITDIYTDHGRLYRCMVEKYFGRSSIPCLTLVSVVHKSPIGVPSAGFRYHANSCYIDSLMMVLFDCSSPYWRSVIMDTDTDTLIYEALPCRKTTLDNTRLLARKIQKQIRIDYDTIHRKGKSTTCSVLRNYLADCLPDMKQGGSWSVYNVASIYSLLCDIFPPLLMEVPIRVNHKKRTERLALLNTWDYMGASEGEIKTIRWSSYDYPTLVFYNGGTPRIRHFDKIGQESGSVRIGSSEYPFSVKKIRAFGETILDGRYSLVGAIVLEGISPTEEGGTHYSSYFRSTNGSWYHYDDTSISRSESGPIKLERFPLGIFTERGGRMPSMYFYAKNSVPHGRSKKFSSQTLEGITYSQVKRDDNSELLFVTDTTPNLIHTEKLKSMNPDVRVSDTTYMWKLPSKEGNTFMDKIRRATS